MDTYIIRKKQDFFCLHFIYDLSNEIKTTIAVKCTSLLFHLNKLRVNNKNKPKLQSDLPYLSRFDYVYTS